MINFPLSSFTDFKNGHITKTNVFIIIMKLFREQEFNFSVAFLLSLSLPKAPITMYLTLDHLFPRYYCDTQSNWWDRFWTGFTPG